ncbi:unnamed protein product [Chondrus crispus]|uniref:Uncharacterized protein n=1 Tax=Chondrus crispus TaxID=2769 RepID=R7QGA0_CHOCR|nr:unnamed protein product [Chondrus crispus]CDF37537.1 unnamed protein product [Chondrus crispus]|eukprot:XP_005717408.1 unnamed protein product [Chondrus crispus]
MFIIYKDTAWPRKNPPEAAILGQSLPACLLSPSNKFLPGGDSTLSGTHESTHPLTRMVGGTDHLRPAHHRRHKHL